MICRAITIAISYRANGFCEKVGLAYCPTLTRRQFFANYIESFGIYKNDFIRKRLICNFTIVAPVP